MTALFAISFFSAIGFFQCGPAEKELQTLYQNSQYLLTYQLGTEIEFNCQSEGPEKGRYARALSLYNLGEVSEATRLFQTSWKNKHYQEKANTFLKIFIFENSETLHPDWALKKNIWKNRSKPTLARQYINATRYSNIEKENLLAQIRQIDESRKYSPLAIASLSLIPGLGQAVMHDWSSSAISLVLNGLFGYATYEFFDHKLYAPASISATIFSITYVGGMIQAGRLAAAKNQYESKSNEASLKNDLFSDLLNP